VSSTDTSSDTFGGSSSLLVSICRDLAEAHERGEDCPGRAGSPGLRVRRRIDVRRWRGEHCTTLHSSTVPTNLLLPGTYHYLRLLVARIAYPHAIPRSQASYGGEFGKKAIPQKWTGDEVEVSIRTDVPEESTGNLKEVNDGGIVVSFTVKKDDKEYGRTVFYPWHIVNWIRPAEDKPL
jgi:hypothetical protein